MGVDLLSEATSMLTTERTCVLIAACIWGLFAGVVPGPMATFLTLPYRSPGYLDAEKSDCQKGVRFGMPVLSVAWGCLSFGGLALPIFSGAVALRSCGAGLIVGARFSEPAFG